MKKVILTSLASLGLVASLAIAGPAAADPPASQYPEDFNGVGSDTTEVVMRELDQAIDGLASWDVNGPTPYDIDGPVAFPGGPTTTPATGCLIAGRILGSGGGQTALANSVTNGDGCFEYGRSSSRATSRATATVGGNYSAAAATVQQLPIALATDGLGYVFRAGSDTPRNLTIGQLRAIYACQFVGTVDGLPMFLPSVPNRPLLPTDLSGSRADWVALMGLAAGGDVASDGGAYPSCIDDGPGDAGAVGAGGQEIPEHNGVFLTNSRQIILHSIGQYIAQGRSQAQDARGLALLGYINGNPSLQQFNNPAGELNPSTPSGSTVVDGAFFRNVYNNIPLAAAGDPAYEAIFGIRTGGANQSGSDIPQPNSGAICNNDAIIINNGFNPVC